MAGTKDDLAALPPPVRERLDELRSALVAAIGDGLRAMIVHGSAARGGYRMGQSDVDVVVLADDAHG
jgi:predicted nucleotidyltransferase